MRNLKKFLALVLAMVMAFSLMLSANAANPVKDFDDFDSITEEFQEAADVLTGMKVFQGDEGGFRPGDTIIRAEVAALIYRLATGDVDDVRAGAYANYGNFTDVNESDWFAGYVGYCANAGYIKGTTPTTFEPYAPVTGYETLAMILRAIGYDKNNEFTGTTWETNVSALATQLGILKNIKTTHYGNTLYLASRRDVVAELLFRADSEVPMVVYTPAFGYQQTGMDGGVVSSTENPTLGWHIFGLAYAVNGVVIGNQQTGEKNTRLGWGGSTEKADDGTVILPYSWTPFTWYGSYEKTDVTTLVAGVSTANQTKDVTLGDNDIFNVETGIDLFGHKLKIWFDGRGSSFDSTKGRPVYAYFDKATATDVVYADNTILNASGAAGTTNLADAIGDTDLKVNSSKTAVFSNSFGKFGTLEAPASTIDETQLANGDGVATNGATPANQFASPVSLYKIISNNNDKTVDAVIALNIESSQITESNNVNRVPTIGLPVENWAASPEAPATGSFFVEGVKGDVDDPGDKSDNLKNVNGTVTGVLAQAALVGNSTKTLGDYEMGIHITGTSRRSITANEAAAINDAANKDELERSYFLLNKLEATVEGKVVAYNVDKGTVTLDNGTVLERSKFYHTVVGWTDSEAVANSAPNTAIPQGWVQGATYWEEGYANVTYKFYTDYEGKYLGAERTFGATFLYGTYMDYSQATSTSTFNYYLTGVTMDGKVETVQLKQYWKADASRAPGTTAMTSCTLENITGTIDLGVPFRDTLGAGGNAMNGIGEGVYSGFAITGEIADGLTADLYLERNEYLNNMARLGVKWGAVEPDDTTANAAFAADILIDKTATTLGAIETVNGTSNKYFTEGTKFILVEGYGTDSVKAEVYNGISELKGTAAVVTLNMDGEVDNTTAGAPAPGDVRLPNITEDTAMNEMTYYTESPYTYAQSGQTAMKIDTIILPKAAVSWSGGSGLYYVGDPTPVLVNSWGEDAWKYDLYVDGELQQVWLTNSPSDTTAGTVAAPNPTYSLTKDTFLNLKATGDKANDGQPIYTAGHYDQNGAWVAGMYFDNTTAVGGPGGGTTPVYNATTNRPNLGYMMGVDYSAVTRDAQTATFSGNGMPAAILERVAGAKVVNLNKDAEKIDADGAGAGTALTSGEIWPGITDLTTLNEAGSIAPVTGRALKVSAVVDPDNPLVVTCIYVCFDQTP